MLHRLDPICKNEELGFEGNTWLFFGDQHFTTDFLYQTEWQEWLEDGTLSKLDVAFLEILIKSVCAT